MKKKFTMLLATFLTFVGVAMAGVTDLPQMSTADAIKWYTISNTRSTSGQYLYWTENGVKDADAKKMSSLFYFTGTAEECYIHNAATNLLFTGVGAWNETGVKCKISVTPFGDGTTGLAIEFSGTALNESNTGNGYTTWGANDAGSVFVIEEAPVAQMVADYKTAAKTALDMLPVGGVDKAKAAIDALEANIDAFAAVDAIVNGVAQYVAFRNSDTKEGSVRIDAYLLANMTNVKGHGNKPFNHLTGIWSLKYSGEGSFYIYNVNQKVYLGSPNSNGTLTEAPSAAYTFEKIEDNKVEFKHGDQTLHLNNHNGNGTVNSGWFLSSYDSDDPASRWHVETDNAAYVANYKTSALAALDGWKTLSVVFDAALIETAKTAINAFETTDYATIAAIDAELKKVTDAVAAKMITFQTIDVSDAARVNVWISANASTMKAFGAAKDAWDYNAVWSLQHAGGSSFYLYNELNSVYLGAPVNNTEAIVLTEAPTAAYTFEIIEGKGENVVEMHCNGGTIHASNHTDDKLISYDGNEDASRWMVNVIDITKDIKNLLATIEEGDYAEVPELGQYSKAGYDALVAAQPTAKTVEEVEAAIAAFKAAKNRPVFTIGNGNVKDYAKDKSIYDDNDGTLNFKATNVYDKTMWWALDMTETAVKVTEEVGIYNVGTGNGFWGASSIKVTETNENDGAGIADDNIFLFYTTGNTSPIHFQDQYQEIVRYGSYEATSGSAAMFTYIGNTYDLDKLTDDYFASVNELAAVTVPNFNFATGVNNYDEATKPALDAAVANRTSVLSKLSTADAIAAAKTQLETAIAGVRLNMPVEGHYYRIRCVGEGMKYIQSTIGGNDNRLEMKSGNEGINDGSIFHYVDGGLKSYTEKKFINAYRFKDSENVPQVTFSTAGHGAVGCYYINIGGRYIFGAGDQIDSGSGTPDNRAGYTWWLELADDVVVNNYKESANFTLDAWENLSVLFDAEAVATAKESVNALTDVTELAAIDEVLQGIRNSADGKSVKFENCAADDRGGRFLGYDRGNARIAGVLSNNDDVLWTIKFVDNNTFKLYNFINNIWLGGPDYAYDTKTVTKTETKTETNENGEEVEVEVEVEVEEKSNYRTPAIENEADAVVYKFIIRDNNKVTLSTTTDKIAHLGNSGNNYRIMEYGSDSEASNWSLVNVGTIPFDREGYNTFVASKSDLMNQLVGYAKQLQDEYGLVKTGDKIAVVVNHPSGNDSQPSSNLLDGDNGTFVHSSYDTTMEGEGDNKTMSEGHMNQVEAHYIEVELSEAAQNIFCYFSKRNNNNRPSVVTVLAGNSKDALNEVATLNMAESTDGSVQSYFSEAIDLGAAYTHLRFVVTQTNTGTKFFTLSEFYVLPINATTEGIAALAGASIIDTDLEARLAAADNSLKTFQLPEVKAEVKAVLDANAENHAEEPQLGQYASVAYNALNDTYKACTTSDKLDALREAFEMFKKAKNRPVFTIGNGNVKDYAKDKSIYDDNDGTLNFKATNVYDKTMWWALDQVETIVSVTGDNYVGIYNVGTGNGFLGAASIKVTETNENDGAGIADDNLFLIYKNGGTFPAHFQQSGSSIVEYWSYDATTGSATMFTYIGNTYDLDKLTDEYFAAANELAAMTVPDFTFSVGLNNYNPETKPALYAAIANRAAVLSKFSTAEEIATAKAQLDAAIAGVQINMPVNGKFYRVRCAGEGMKRIQSTINNERLQMIGGDEGINANSIFCYIDGSLLSYTTGQYINAYDLDAVGTKSAVVFSEAYNGTLGQYNIKINDCYIYGKKNEIDSGTDNPTDNGYNWWLEEVTSLPVSIGEVGYTTFYTPIAVKVPEAVGAYVVSEIKDNVLNLTQVKGVVPAHTGLILKGNKGSYNFAVSTEEEATEIASNLLQGTNAKTIITPAVDITCYVLAKTNEVDNPVAFYPIKLRDSEGNVVEKDGIYFINGANKVYLPVKTAGGQAPALMFRFGSTEVEDIVADKETEPKIYDLMGRRVEKMVEGIYIVNGKKVVIK